VTTLIAAELYVYLPAIRDAALFRGWGRYTTSYDPIDRRETVVSPGNKTIALAYDAAGNRRSTTDPDGGRFTCTWDAAGQLKSVRNPADERTTFSYDDAGRRTLKLLANDTRASLSYDAANQSLTVANLDGTPAYLSRYDYQYDDAGNRTSMLEVTGARTTWSYDDANRLSSEYRTGAQSWRNTFTYDEAGNRTLKNETGARTTSTYDDANQLTHADSASGRTTYTFDSDGNQQVVLEPGGNRTTNVWDFENRNVLVALPTGQRVTMSYSPDNRRVEKQSNAGTTKFVWEAESDNILIETNAAGAIQVAYTQEPSLYGNLISQRRGGATSYHHFDALGSTRALTDENENVTDTYLNDAWGVQRLVTGSTENRFRWGGELGYYWDEEIGQLQARARNFRPAIGRWTSRDPLGMMLGYRLTRFAGQFLTDLNLYRYVYDNPLSFLDPSGLKGLCPPGYQQHHWFQQAFKDKFNSICGVAVSLAQTASGMFQGGGSWIDFFTTCVHGGTNQRGTQHYWLHNDYDYPGRTQRILDDINLRGGGCCALLMDVYVLMLSAWADMWASGASGIHVDTLPSLELHKWNTKMTGMLDVLDEFVDFVCKDPRCPKTPRTPLPFTPPAPLPWHTPENPANDIYVDVGIGAGIAVVSFGAWWAGGLLLGGGAGAGTAGGVGAATKVGAGVAPPVFAGTAAKTTTLAGASAVCICAEDETNP
ncbi:MAG: RHS repeat-associated core domain-containing protein, partial [Pirellulales bacterium]